MRVGHGGKRGRAKRLSRIILPDAIRPVRLGPGSHREDLDRFAARRASGHGQAGWTESPGTRSAQALTIIAQNIDLAANGEGAICQDTGMPTFEIKTPVGVNQIVMKSVIRDAVAEATRRGKLRPNSVDSITGENSGDNLGPGTPILHFEQWDRDDEIEIKLILKGGGCENMNAQYSLPIELAHLGRADRTLEGVRKCILHAVWQAQGKGLRAGRRGRCDWRRPHVRLLRSEGTAVSHAR